MTRLPELKRIADLSECEREILALIGNGLRMVQIADRMRRSVKTIEYHRSKIGKKLGVANRVELARVAIQTGLSPVTPAHERDNVRLQQALRVEIARRERSQLALQEIDAGTAAMTGKAFFRSLVRHLALALGCRYACVCDFIEDGKNRGHPIAFWRDDRFVENCDCPRASGICEHLVRQELSYCAAGAQELLRDQEQFVELDVDSYLAAYLRDSRGRPIGMLSVLHDAPIEREAQPELIVRIFAARAGAELERRHTERALHDSEAAIHAILETAVDAIVTIDDAGIIQAANASTSRMFGYSAEELAGQNLKVLGRVP